VAYFKTFKWNTLTISTGVTFSQTRTFYIKLALISTFVILQVGNSSSDNAGSWPFCLYCQSKPPSKSFPLDMDWLLDIRDNSVTFMDFRTCETQMIREVLTLGNRFNESFHNCQNINSYWRTLSAWRLVWIFYNWTTGWFSIIFVTVN